MDALLELLEKYNCHLCRRGKPLADFLECNFDEYMQDLKDALNPKENPLVGKIMCEMVSEKIEEIEDNARRIINVLRIQSDGRSVEAEYKAFELFDDMKPQLMRRYSGAFRREVYYRIRPIQKGREFPLERKELFHIPNSKKHLIGTERYSVSGHPCLCLASQAELCWYECGKPTLFAIAKFDIPQQEDDNLLFVDFSESLILLKYAFVSWFHNANDDIDAVRRYLLKTLYTYPLRAACSVKKEYSGCSYIEEYVFSQFLLQWVVHDGDFDGIRFESCNENETVRALGGHNLVLATKSFDSDGYDKKLRSCVKIGCPMIIDTTIIKPNPKIDRLLDGKKIEDEPFYWDMESISTEYETI